MAFIASTVSLQKGFERMLSLVVQEKAYLLSWSARLDANITALDAVEWAANLTRILSDLDAIAALPGLQAYAQAQFSDGNYDVVAEFTAMRAALAAIRSWIIANIPSNGITITNGVPVGASYAPAATSPLKTLVLAASATIA